MSTDISADDNRIAHVRKCQSLSQSPMMKNYHEEAASALRHEPGVVYIYSFDGELDDQIRLEHLLLVFPATSQLVIVAGQRIDGDDTLGEMARVVQRTLQTKLLQDGSFEGHSNIKLVKGGPLRAPKDDKAQQELGDAVDRLLSCLAGRSFVFHSNASATLPQALLTRKDCPTVKAVLFTCDLALRPTGLVLVANGSWNAEAWLEVRKICQEMNVPFISVHGSAIGYHKQTLNRLEGWADVMFESAENAEDVHTLRKIIRFSLGMNLIWAARGYGAAKGLAAHEMLSVMSDRLQAEGFLPDPTKPSPSDAWTLWAVEDISEYDNMQPETVIHRFMPIRDGANCPINNTVGDFCASGLDAPEISKSLIFVKIEDLREGENGTRHGTLGGEGDGTHLMVIHADEVETLDAAWNRIKAARKQRQQDSGQAPLDILDEQLKREWRAYRRRVQEFAQEVVANAELFPAHSVDLMRQALANLKEGEMARRCAE